MNDNIINQTFDNGDYYRVSKDGKIEIKGVLQCGDESEIKKLLRNDNLERAQSMLDSIKSQLEIFYKDKPPRNRKERRERAMALKRDIETFKAYCKKNKIDIKYNGK